MSKYYAVKVGRKSGIYNSWSECQKQTSGFSGAIFKSFKIYDDATNFITPVVKSEKPILKIEKQPISILPTKSKKIINIYTDGSHQPYNNNYLGAGAYCNYKENEYELSITCDKEYLTKYKIKEAGCSNPTAEFFGFAEVLRYFVGVSGYSIHFHIDYEGVDNWMNGSWNCKKTYIKKIKEYCKEILTRIKCDVHIFHIDGHSGNKGNDRADILAKSPDVHSNFQELIDLL